jgi:elongation factor 3
MTSDEDFISELMATAFERPSYVASQLPTIVPKMADYMVDGRKRVRDMSTKALLACCRGLLNNDIRPFVPKLVECIEDPTKVPDCIRQLAATTFVQSVDAPTLAITVPVLLRGLTERSTPIRRMSCVIIDTMAKLVDDPTEARQFVDALRTRVEDVVGEISHPEARKVAEKTLATLREPRLSGTTVTELPEETGDDATVICDCTFSLAYGAKILLSNTRLHLKRGQRYGLCGPNGAGKSTLMRAIANGQVDGFPPSDQVRTVYVEHDIDASQSPVSVHEFVGLDVASDPAYGFTPEVLEKSIGSLSGGWKMKVALARAMAAQADILLLDEPTNHLDVSNVRWLSEYLKGLKDVTSIIVSHDSGFLDDVCTCIIHYETRKLVKYPGNLASLVKHRPEAKAYYTLTSESTRYVLPAPGFLEGVTSKDRAILKMRGVSFSYSASAPCVIREASLQASLNSRVAIVGPNGAGKSTLVKLLTGELEPTEGTVWKHPNLRVAYVAQHAFHHIEHHLDKTPNQYIQWRYATGEDRESSKKVDRQMTQEDVQTWEGLKRKPEQIVGRRKLKQGYEYEVRWADASTAETSWLTRPALEALGCVAMVNEVDAREAAAAGMVGRPLTAANIERMLGDLGLDSDLATHSVMRGLSGGQKVKVVLGAVMWQQPHILVLDEPTNYLDRESLAALAGALKEFEGGVVVISHHAEFLEEIPCPETWKVGGGSVVVEGGSAAGPSSTSTLNWKRQDEVTDAFGNTIKVKDQGVVPRSRKELKAAKKLKEARRARGEIVSDSDD